MKRRLGILLVCTGLLLSAAAIALAGYNLYDGYRAARSARSILDQLEEFCPAEAPAAEPVLDPDEVMVPDYLLDPDMEMPVRQADGLDYIGVLRIPSLDLELPVLSDWNYTRLRIAPCRYAGTAYTGDFVIAAHNYASHFGALKEIQEGAAVLFTDMDGNVFQYRAVLLETLMPTAVSEMKSGGWDLTLFTCTLGGAYRVTVRCERVDDVPPALALQ